ncbi:MAG: hypothetical protein ABIC18_01830 [Candidatus Omnitrophota bacterium]
MIKRSKDTERRIYIRLDSVFPVNFRLTTQDKQAFLSDWIQGFTNNISRGGICLTVNNLKPEFIEMIEKREINLLLNIQIPLSAKSTSAWARPTWIEPVSGQPGQYLIGLSYSSVPVSANRRIVSYAWMKYFVPRISAGLLIILAMSIGVSGYFNWKLTSDNRNLVEHLVQVAEDSEIAKEIINRIGTEKQELNSRLGQIQSQIKIAEGEKNQLVLDFNQIQETIEAQEKASQDNVKKLALLIDRLNKEKGLLQEKLTNLQSKEIKAAADLSVLDQTKTQLQQATFDNMYQWVLRHQNPRTGLISSFEGDADIANWAFTYDQALAACAYSYAGDFRNAKKILDFFNSHAKKTDGGFLNAYYADDGQAAEYSVHCGPNIWLGIAIMQYTQESHDTRYLDLAKKIAKWVIRIQNEDKEGGIRGGLDVGWYATEHNLDAYAFFNMLYKKTGEERYKEALQRVVDWLLLHIYDRPDVPIKRGKGDSTIATDTYTWSIAALGPDKLEKIGMSADDIIEFAEEYCYVEVDYRRPDGKVVKVKGFDFAAQRNLARGGVVSCEWTAQMILSLKIMERFYKEKQMPDLAKIYHNKADDYLWQLSQMIISSPSPSGQGRGCLPYASSDSADTGHGWKTPKGISTGSVAATTYTLFAYYGWNPLELNE